MSVSFKTGEFFQTSGNTATDFTEKLRDGIVQFSCEIWSEFPDFIVNSKSIASSFARGYMNSVCDGQVPLPTLAPLPYEGGQCEGVQYNVDLRSENYFNGEPRPDVTSSHSVYGPIEDIYFGNSPAFGNSIVQGHVVRAFNAQGVPQDFVWPVGGYGWSGQMVEITIARADGLADSCGNLPQSYNSPQPTSQDLTTNIEITSNNNEVSNFVLTHNELSTEYHFPIGFKLNGVNVTLDLSGLTIHGNDTYVSPTSNNDPEPPGHDGGGDGVGGGDDEIHPDQDVPTLPDFSKPSEIEKEIAKIICEDGVISSVTEIVKTLPGVEQPLVLIIDMLGAIITELCEFGEIEANVGLPEYYSVRPGHDRPALVLLYKTWDGEKWGASTYSTTVPHPNSGIIDNISDLAPPIKTTGKYVASVTLTDGSRIRASGVDEDNAKGNLFYYVTMTDQNKVSFPLDNHTYVTFMPGMTERVLHCRQIDYYEDGRAANLAPSIRRVIDPPEP